MTDVDGLLRSTLHRHAEDAPAAGDLLPAVHERSRRLGRRRRLAMAGAAVAAGTAVAVALGLAVLPRTGTRPASVPDTVSAAPVPPAPASAVADPTPTRAPDSATALRLVPPAYTVPALPFRPTVTPVGGLAQPVVMLAAGELSAYYAANDPVRGADVTIRVGPRPPSFDVPADRAGPAHETAHQVRGHPGTLRTVDVAPARQLSLYWQESPGRWVRVDTDDTLTDAEVVQLADALVPASVPVVTPFRLDLVPAAMELDTSTPSVMAFRPAGGSAVVSCSLVGFRQLAGPTVAVGGHRGVVRRTGTVATLTVALDDRDATLVVEVPYPISDADLVRFAAAVHVTDRAEPQP